MSLHTMDVTNILPQLERLDGDIDNLEEALQPILKGVSDLSSKLPLLEKAKLYVLATYALESMLFCMFLLHPALQPRMAGFYARASSC